MATSSVSPIQYLRRIAMLPSGASLSDEQLLDLYIDRQDHIAFEMLVRRHGPMVFGVCRRLLPNPAGAEDAFQATFLVLVRKAHKVVPRSMVGNWLYGVASKAALKARAASLRRRKKEKQLPDFPDPPAMPADDRWWDLKPLLDRELGRLAEKYRAPIILCDIERKTHKEAAKQLGWPEGTLSVRLMRARKILAKRLTGQGLSLSAAPLAVLLSENAASAKVPIPLIGATVNAASMAVAGQTAVAGTVSVSVSALTQGVLKAMVMTKIKAMAAVLVMGSLIGLGGGVVAYQAVVSKVTSITADANASQPKPAVQAPNKEQTPAKRLTKDAASAAEKNLAEAGDAAQAQKSTKSPLQGVWKVKSKEFNGLLEKLDEIAFMFEGKWACWQSSNGNAEGRLYVDLIGPGTFDLVKGDLVLEGVYSVEGDVLRLCYVVADLTNRPKRPTQFSSKAGDGQVLVVLKRMEEWEHFDQFRLLNGSRGFPTIVEYSKVVVQPGSDLPPLPTDPLVPSPTMRLPSDGGKGPGAGGQGVGAKQKRTLLIGEIYISGNEKTAIDVINNLIQQFPGQVLDLKSLEAAEKNLAASNRFVVDPQKGIRPTVTVIERIGGDEFRDILVTVKEK